VVSLKVTKDLTFPVIDDFEKKTGFSLRQFTTHATLSIHVDYGDTVHSDNGKVFVEKGNADD